MNEFKSQIGLTNDEVTIIMFTSLDLDWMTNLLILSSHFTNWFYINFAGESREETDFRDSKYDNWLAVCSYAGLIVDEYNNSREDDLLS